MIQLALPHYPALDRFRDTVPEYTDFAVRLRYDDIAWVTRGEAEKALAEVERMREALAELAL